MARYSKQERQEAVDRLRECLKPGDTVYTVLRHCSRSGMLRVIGPVLLPTEEWSQVRHIGFLVAKVLDWPDDGDQGVKVGGYGMDMGFHLVYELSSALFPEGFIPAEAGHTYGRNGTDPHERDPDGGYALNQRWL